MNEQQDLWHAVAEEDKPNGGCVMCGGINVHADDCLIVTAERPVWKAGDRVRFQHMRGVEKVGIIRYFQWQDWADQPVAIIDIEQKGPLQTVRIEQERIIGRAVA